MSTVFTLMLIFLVFQSLQGKQSSDRIKHYKASKQGGTSCPSVRTHVYGNDIVPRVTGSYNPQTQMLSLQVVIQHLQDESTTFPVISFSETDFEHSNFDDKYDLQQFIYDYPVRPQGEDAAYYCTPNNQRKYKENSNWNFNVDSCGSVTFYTNFSVKDEEDLFKLESNATHSYKFATLYVRSQRGAATLDTFPYNITLVTKLGATSTSNELVVPKFNVEQTSEVRPQIIQQGGRIDVIFNVGRKIQVTQVIQSLSDTVWVEDKPVSLKCKQDNDDAIIQFMNAGFGQNSRDLIIKYKEYDCETGKAGKEKALEIQLYDYAELELTPGSELDIAVPLFLPANDTHFYFDGPFDVKQIICGNEVFYKKEDTITINQADDNDSIEIPVEKHFSDIFLPYDQCETASVTYVLSENNIQVSYDIDTTRARLSPVQATYRKFQTAPVEKVRAGAACQAALNNAFRNAYEVYCAQTKDTDVCVVPPDDNNDNNGTPDIPDDGIDSWEPEQPVNPGNNNTNNGNNNSTNNGTSDKDEECEGDECAGDGIERIGKLRLGAIGLLALGLLI